MGKTQGMAAQGSVPPRITGRKIGFWLGPALFALAVLLPAPDGMTAPAWNTAGLVGWMASWWMTQAVPLTATGLLPFVVLPFASAGTAREVASDYYSPIIFLLLGGAFLALAIERTGMHKRLACWILDRIGGRGGSFGLLLGFMIAAAILSNIISNTSTTLIMMPMALAVLAGGTAMRPDGSIDQSGLSGALPMGLAFAASIGGLGTIIGSPTNAIAVALLRDISGMEITFAKWASYGVPVVLLGIPLAAFIISRVQRISDHPFDVKAAREAIDPHGPWSVAERRLLMMFGGGLALAGAMTRSGLADWLGNALLPLATVPVIVMAIAMVAMVVLITEFASNVATASGIMPVVASLAVAMGGDPVLLALPVALAASWGFVLPAGTGPNAIAWATGRIALPRLIKAGLVLDFAGVFLIVGVVFALAPILG